METGLVWIDLKRKTIHAPRNMTYNSTFDNVCDVMSSFGMMSQDFPYDFPEGLEGVQLATTETRPLKKGWKVSE